MSIFFYVTFIILFLILSLLLCGVILLQEGKTTGLGSSFGGDASESVFGTSTADVLKKITAVMTALFFGSCILLSAWTSSLNRAKEAPTTPYEAEQIEAE